MTRLRSCILGAMVIFLFSPLYSHAQVVTTLADLSGYDGFSLTSLIQGRDASYYGASAGEVDGALYRITAAGRLRDLHVFTEDFGTTPTAVLLGVDGNLYGTTDNGGADFLGSIFKLTPSGSFSTVYSFTGRGDGSAPMGGLIAGADGNFYGTTYGGANGYGTVFEVSPAGSLTTLHVFNYNDGASPSGVIQGVDGRFYGTTSYGGNLNCVVSDLLSGCGVVFSVDSAGNFSLLHEFNSTDGATPYAGLLQASDGHFYGTTAIGGDPTCQCGTVFRISSRGSLHTIYEFREMNDGGFPLAPMIQATDGAVYGTTTGNGVLECTPTNSCGSIFRIAPGGKFTTLYSFCLQSGCPDGLWPHAGLLQSTSGLMYGTTSEGGGPCSCGTVFTLNMNLQPFVTFVNRAGKVGASVQILGQDLTGASAVSFNGVPAIFNVISDTFLKAVVPVGATSGPVMVTTTSGMLTSNIPFRVRR